MMNLIDALCVIAASYNARSKEEEQVYKQARDLVEEHAEQVMGRHHIAVASSVVHSDGCTAPEYMIFPSEIREGRIQ